MDQVLEPFAHLDETTTRLGRSGLAFAVCHKLAAAA
jgi:hypothetical protein